MNDLLERCFLYEQRIGKTPLYRISSLEERNIKMYMKMEGKNVTGSTKDRSAYAILKNAIINKEVRENTTIIESSSGNFGIAMAALCKFLGLKFICVCDKKTTNANLNMLKLYGAEIVVVEEKDERTKEYLPKRLETVRVLSETISNSYVPNQYGNLNSPLGHEETMREIAETLENSVDYIFVAVSTFGTLRGYADYIQKQGLNTKIIAIDAEGSVLFDTKKRKRVIPGHGAACVPSLFCRKLVDDFILVNDMECVNGCRFILKNEGVLVGGSTGGIVAGIMKYIEKIIDNSVCVFIMHDAGDRYIDTVYSDMWVKNNVMSLE